MTKKIINKDAAIVRILAANDSSSKDVRILSIIVAKLKFRDIQRHVFGAHFGKVPITPRLKIDQKPSMVWVWIAPMTY